ncbi:hypothetical protein [Metallibacterium scheffleri]
MDRIDYSTWAEISTEGLEQIECRRISLLTSAIKAYVDGQLFDPSLKSDGIYRATLLRAFNRCITLDASGRPFGWAGLCRGLRVHSPVRRKALEACGPSKRAGLTGALTQFLCSHADLAEKFGAYLYANAKREPGNEARLRVKSAHQKFIKLCKDHGVQVHEWPLCTRQLGYESIRQFAGHFLDAHYDDIVATQFGDRAKARSRTGTGHPSRLVATRPFDIIEIDEHRCQFMGSIGVPTPEGTRWFPMERITIIVVADRFLALVLGYKVLFRREANSGDLLDALNCAVGNGKPSVAFEGCQVEFGKGLPSELGGPFSRCGWNQLLFDNALIHLAEEIIGRVRDLIGCDVNFGPVRHFERRPTIENIFGLLENAGFRRIQSTTGTSPQDPMRQQPDKVAVDAKLSVQQILGFIESVILDHNGVASKSNFGSFPLARLEAAWHDVDKKGIIIPVLPSLPPGVADLDVSVVPLTVRGDRKSGRRPYFTFEQEAYTGPLLACDWSLLGTHAVGHVKREAIRSILVFSLSGVRIDTATVMGRWRHSEHSRDLRAHVNSLIKAQRLKVGYSEDPVHKFLESVKAGTKDQAAPQVSVSQRDLAITATEQQAAIPSRAPVPPSASHSTPGPGSSTPTGASPDSGELASELNGDDYLEYELTAFGTTET